MQFSILKNLSVIEIKFKYCFLDYGTQMFSGCTIEKL